MVSASIIECIGGTPLVRLRRLFSRGPQVYAKLELLNPGGSVKDRPARYIIERGLRDGTIAPGATIVESSSGNFGIALAMAARIYELDFVCVVDPRIAPLNLRILEQLGARIEMVTKPDPYGGYLHTRLERVQELLARYRAPTGSTSTRTTSTRSATTTASAPRSSRRSAQRSRSTCSSLPSARARR